MQLLVELYIKPLVFIVLTFLWLLIDYYLHPGWYPTVKALAFPVVKARWFFSFYLEVFLCSIASRLQQIRLFLVKPSLYYKIYYLDHPMLAIFVLKFPFKLCIMIDGLNLTVFRQKSVSKE